MVKVDKTSALTTYLLVFLLIVGAYFIGVYKTQAELLSAGVGGGSNLTKPVGGGAPEQITNLLDEDWQSILVNPAFAMGDPDALVTIVEFTDYQCPFCARNFTDTYPQLKSDYVDNGLVYYIFRDFPLGFHPNAEDAAVAARCAGTQGKYLEMHDLLFVNQGEWEGLSDAKETFASYGDTLGLNIRSCQNDSSVLEAVLADSALGTKLGVSGTPSFFINGELLVGAQPYATFQQVIDELL